MIEDGVVILSVMDDYMLDIVDDDNLYSFICNAPSKLCDSNDWLNIEGEWEFDIENYFQGKEVICSVYCGGAMGTGSLAGRCVTNSIRMLLKITYEMDG